MEFRHPKYYAEMRAERRKLQAASAKPQASSDGELRANAYAKLASRIMGKPQAPSVKHQADIKNHE